jgi:hypothetical protein
MHRAMTQSFAVLSHNVVLSVVALEHDNGNA